MKKIILFLFLAIFNLSFCQYSLTIEVGVIDNLKGQLVIGVCNNKNTFLKEFDIGTIVKVTKKNMILTFENLPKGEYAISLFHDENSNNKLETNLFGIPIEKYGFSNNKIPFFGTPSYDDSKFILNENKKILIKLN
jgi:uncharacterized protein (DUF2141 family)